MSRSSSAREPLYPCIILFLPLFKESNKYLTALEMSRTLRDTSPFDFAQGKLLRDMAHFRVPEEGKARLEACPERSRSGGAEMSNS